MTAQRTPANLAEWVAGMPRSASAATTTTTATVLDAAKRAADDAAAYRDTPAKKRQRMEELEERARLFGDPVKQSAQAKVLERKWQRFLLVYGDEYGFDERVGPTVELVKHFVTYCFCTRDRVSAVGREGMGVAGCAHGHAGWHSGARTEASPGCLNLRLVWLHTMCGARVWLRVMRGLKWILDLGQGKDQQQC